MSEISKPGRRKLPARFTPVVFAFYMSGIMAMLICLVVTAANNGIHVDYLERVMAAYKLAMPVAFVAVMIVRPIVMRLVNLTVNAP